MEISDLLHENRLVTLTGSGGCGKTRLSQEIAISLLEEYGNNNKLYSRKAQSH